VSPCEGRVMKVIKGSSDDRHILWVVVESDAVGDETMSGFVTEDEAKAFHYALRSSSLTDAEKLRCAALVRVENGKYTTPRVFWEP
jgi:hypothetical protein